MLTLFQYHLCRYENGLREETWLLECNAVWLIKSERENGGTQDVPPKQQLTSCELYQQQTSMKHVLAMYFILVSYLPYIL
jgi:hypothetical protein